MSWLPELLQKLLKKIFKSREESNGDAVKPFLEHLEDLRWTIMKMALVLIGGMIVGFIYVDVVSALILAPYHALVPGGRLIGLTVVEGFMVSLKLAFYSGIVLSFPFLLYFAAEFILPALTRQEKKMLFPALAAGFVLFAIGVWLAYTYILPLTLKWFYDYAMKMQIDPSWQARDYYGFVAHLSIACGLLAELPVAVLALAFMGMVTSTLLRNTRAYAYTLILILVAVISPTPDPMTFFIMSLPVLTIYEICIWLVWGMERRRASVIAQGYGD
jgi:sec-independent protein translocase protein TatC